MRGRMVAGLALLLASCGGSESGGTVSVAEDGLLRVVAYDRQDFDADLYEASAGEIDIELVLDGFLAHTLVVEGLEAELRLEVGADKVDSGTITLAPGRYILYCYLAGHRSSGMVARLLVA